MLFTYRDLQDALDNLTEEQLDQQVQILPHDPDGDKVLALEPVICFNTVGHFLEGTQKVRSCVDNEHHDDDLVLLTDGNMYAEDGSIAENLLTGEKIFPKKEGVNG